MTPAQKTAINNPARFAFETARPRFAHNLPGGKYALVMTVNSGWE